MSTGMLFLLFSANLLVTARAWFWNSPEWGNLRVTYGLNPFGSEAFDEMPRTEGDAISDGWVKISDCNASASSLGRRYVKGGDRAVTLLFDVKGYIAGIQAGLLKSGLPAGFPPAGVQRHILQDDGQYLTITAYFSDPAIICNGGRTAAMFDTDGTGRDLYIQNGSDRISDSVRMPHEETALEGTPWTFGRCFVGMGNHYWYNVSENMNCEDFFPVFLMYNRGRLNAFGWAFGVPQSSPRFEHPPSSQLGYFFQQVPRCLSSYPELSTMHIYLHSHPLTNFC